MTVPALPGLFTQGETRDEAPAAARGDRLHLECLADEGEPIPDDDVVVDNTALAVA